MNASVEFMKDSLASAGAEKVMAFAADDATRNAIMGVAPNAAVHDGGIQAAINAMSQQPSPQVLLVDLAENEAPEAALRSLKSLCDGSTRIVCIGAVNDVKLFHGLLAAGAADYLLKPLSAEDVVHALEQAVTAQAGPQEVRSGCRTVVVTGARGGCGTSTLVTGMAWHLAEQIGKNVAVVDLDLLFGTVALAFDLEPSHGLREILENPQRVDSLFIESAVVRASEKLSILAAEEMFENPPNIRQGAMKLLIEELGKSAGCIFIDVPCPILIAHPEILEQADHVAVVTELKLAAIRDIMRLTSFLRDDGRNIPISIVANKVPTKDKPEVELKEFSRGIGMPLSFVLPWDPKSVTEAAQAGRALTEAAPKSPIAKVIVDAAIALSGHQEEAEAKQAPFWSRLVKKG